MKAPRCLWQFRGPPGAPLALRGPPGVSWVYRGFPEAPCRPAPMVERLVNPSHLRGFRCIDSSNRFSRRLLSSLAGASNNNNNSSSSNNNNISNSTSSRSSRPGLLQLPGVHTPEQLVQLAHECLRDCQLLLESEEKRELKKETDEGETRRSVQVLDAVSNALCKVADAAELIRSVHPSNEWQQAGLQVVQEVQQFMSVANFSDAIYKRLRGSPAPKTGEGEEGLTETPRHEGAAAAAKLTEEEAVVLQCMRESMEQQGIHLSPKEKTKHLLLLEKEMEAASACIAAQDEGPRLEVSVEQLLAAGVPQGLVSMRTAELQQQQQQQQQRLFSLWGRKKEKRPTSLTLTGDDEFTKAVLRTCKDVGLRRELHALMEGSGDSSSDGKFLRLLALRQELARGRGFSSWAAFAQREGVLRTPEAVSVFLERVELALKPGLETELGALKSLAETLPQRFGVQLPLQPHDVPFLMELHALQHKSNKPAACPRLSLETVWSEATEIVESLTGFRLVPSRPAPGETWHWSVLKFELRPSGCGQVSPRGVLYVDLFSRRDKTRLLAQFTVRGSKQMNYLMQQGWELGGPLTRASVAEDEEGCLRQIPCCALVSNFCAPPRLLTSVAEGSPEEALSLLKECFLTQEESTHLLHELGHAVHALLSQTEMQHLSGTRGAVDFAEFPSHLFEFFSPRIYGRHAPQEPAAGEARGPQGFARFQIAHQLMLALLDRAFYSYTPSPCLLTSSGELRQEAEASEAKKLNEFLNLFFDQRKVLGLTFQDVTKVPLWQLVGKPPFRAFEHLVHYGGNYFCYLFCRCTSSYVWSIGLGKEKADLNSGSRLLQLLERGSTDCTAAPLLKLVEGLERPEVIQELSVHPEKLPLQYFLKHAGLGDP